MTMIYIERKYQEFGGETGILGKATSGDIKTGRGMYKEFEHGIIIFSPSFGACVLTEKIVRKWRGDFVVNTIADSEKGTTLKDFLGFPTLDTYKTQEGGEICFFERGMILNRPRDGEFISGGDFVIYGEVYRYYQNNNGINGWIGFPITDIEIGNDNGRIGRFENADIYWHKSVGTFEIKGGFRNRYLELDNEKGILGYPISNEIPIIKNGFTIGKQQNFANGGTIFWSSANDEFGAYEVHGEILKTYNNKDEDPDDNNRTIFDKLGFPTSNQKSSISGKYHFNNFEHGILVLNKLSGEMRKITKIDFRITHYESTNEADDSTFGIDDDDLYLEVKIIPSITINGFKTEYRIPESGDSNGHSSVDSNFTCTIPVNNGNQEISLNVNIWDADGGARSGEDKIGEFTDIYTIDTLWDTGSDSIRWYGDLDEDGDLINGKAKVDFNFEADGFIIDPYNPEKFRRTLFWNINNPAGKTKIKDSNGNDTATDQYPDLKEFSWEVYASTFRDVEQNESHILHPFNYLFYKYLYKPLPNDGICFGMCVEAIYAMLKRSVSNEPVFQYSFDAQRKEDILIKLGYQWGGDQIDYILKTSFSGDMWNPVNTYHKSRELFFNGDYPVLCLSPTAMAFKGHAVLPYKWEERSFNEWVIWVANPNSPFGEKDVNGNLKYESNIDGDRIIIINPQNNTFSLEFGNGNWTGTGETLNGGRFFVIPYSEVSSEPRTPFVEIGLAALLLIPIAIVAAETAAGIAAGAVLVGAAATEAAVATGIGAAAGGVAAAEVVTVSVGAIALGVISTILGGVMMICGSDAEVTQVTDGNDKKYFNDDSTLNTDPNSRIDNFIHISKVGDSDSSNQRPSAYYLCNERIIEPINNSFQNRTQAENTPIMVGLSDFIRKSNTLNFDVLNTGNNVYEWAIASAHSKIILTSNATNNNIDSVSIAEIGTSQQAFSFKASNDAIDKKIKLDIISFDSSRKFELSNMNIPAGKSLTFEQNNAGRAMIIHGSTEDITLDLKYFYGDLGVPRISIPNITIEKNVITILEAITTQQIQKTTLSEIGGQPISTTNQTTISIDCKNLIHEWLVLLRNGENLGQPCINTLENTPDLGGWFYCYDRVCNFNLVDDTYFVVVQSGTFSLIQFTVKDGKISYDPKLEGIISGINTSTLVLNGLPLTIDATAITNHIVYLGGVYSLDGGDPLRASRSFAFGNFLPTSNDGMDGWEYTFIMDSGVVASFTFKLTIDGKAIFKTQFNDTVLGNGSNNIKILEFTPRE
jgi:hypothetical protein